MLLLNTPLRQWSLLLRQSLHYRGTSNVRSKRGWGTSHLKRICGTFSIGGRQPLTLEVKEAQTKGESIKKEIIGTQELRDKHLLETEIRWQKLFQRSG